MGEISVEQRLMLAQQLREKHRQDRTDLSARERILYGRETDQEGAYRFDGGEDEDASSQSTFRIRMLLTAVCVVTILLLDRRGDSLFGITSAQILEYVSRDYTETVMEAAMNTIEGLNADLPQTSTQE